LLLKSSVLSQKPFDLWTVKLILFPILSKGLTNYLPFHEHVQFHVDNHIKPFTPTDLYSTFQIKAWTIPL